jgi:hypothetical protein
MMMRVGRRFLIWTSGIVISIGLLAVTHGSQTAEKLLQKWFFGVVLLFFILFAVLTVFAVRENVVRSLWVVPVGAVLAYPAAVLSYVLYFTVMEPTRFAMKHFWWPDILFGILIGPTISLAWVFGGLAGLSVFLLSRIFYERGT